MAEDEKRWIDARDRMRPYIDAVFWQDHGIDDPDKNTSVDWILDRIFRDEFIGALNDTYSIWRKDDGGQHYLIESGLRHDEASKRIKEFESAQHKQFYWITPDMKGKTNT